MPKNKIQKFKENLSFPHLFQPGYHELLDNGFDLKGNWLKSFFKNKNPIILELGCGKGEYAVGLAAKYPNNNYIGVDVKGARLWRGAKSSDELNIKNVAFIRAKIEMIDYCFATNEVDEIWITFPDPQPKSHKAHKRLVSPRLLGLYKQFLKPDGIIHLKTDNLGLFEYCLEIIELEKHQLIYQSTDLYNSDLKEDVISIQTFYEKQYLAEGKKINYLKFCLYE